MEHTFFAAVELEEGNALADIGAFYAHDEQSLGGELSNLVRFVPGDAIIENPDLYALKVEVAFVGWLGDDLHLMYAPSAQAPSIHDNVMITDCPFQRSGEFQIHDMLREAALNLVHRTVDLSMEIGEAGTFSDRLPLDLGRIVGDATFIGVGTYTDITANGKELTLLFFMELPASVCSGRSHLTLWDGGPRHQLEEFTVLEDLPVDGSQALAGMRWFQKNALQDTDISDWWLEQVKRHNLGTEPPVEDDVGSPAPDAE